MDKNIDNAYLEESWDMMKDLLDKEMPEAPRPGPAGKNWLTAILILLFAWTAYLYWPEPVAKATTPAIEENIENIESTAATEPLAFNVIEKSSSKDNINSAPAPKTTLKQPRSQYSKPITKSTNQFFNSTAKAMGTADKAVADAKLKQGNWLIKSGAEMLPTAAKIEKEVDRNQDQNDPPIFTNTFAQTDVLKSNGLAQISNAEAGNTFPLERMNMGKKDWSLALKFEAIFDRRLFSGKYYGLEFQHSLSNQFSLAAGVGYGAYQKINTAENRFEALQEFFNMEPSTGGDADALSQNLPIVYDSDDKYAIIGVEEMNYVTVPVELVFAVNSKAKVVAGVGFSYLLNAKFNETSGVKEWTSHEDGTVISDYKDLLGTAIQRFDIAPSIGFSFQAMDKLRLDLRFRNGLLDLSKDKFLGFEYFHSNKYLHLGMAYDIFRLQK